ncbi:MAG TPA: hypothetical protein ENJ09_15745 [Planctomycetes bacterium]|nr:hypothetical protein [Planctomycetota bacterium]
MAQRRKAKADPVDLLREVEARFSNGALPRGIILRGDERYFRERARDILVKRANELGYEVCMHHAERGNPDFQLSHLTGDLSGGGLFAGQRLVVVHDGAEYLAKVGGKPSQLTQAIEAFLAAPDDPGTLVLSIPSLRADHAVSKAVVASGGPILDLRKLYDSPSPWNPDPRQVELVRWLLGRARELGVKLRPDQAVYVCAATGNDLFALEDQLTRLRGAAPDELARIVGWNASIQPWTVAESLVAGDARKALAGIETLFRGGFQDKSGRRVVDTTALSTMLVASVARGVRRSLAIAEEIARGTDEVEAARVAGAAGRAAGEAIARAKSRPPRRWQAMLDEAAELERRAKSSVGLGPDDFALLSVRWARPPSGAATSRANGRRR